MLGLVCQQVETPRAVHQAEETAKRIPFHGIASIHSESDDDGDAVGDMLGEGEAEGDGLADADSEAEEGHGGNNIWPLGLGEVAAISDHEKNDMSGCSIRGREAYQRQIRMGMAMVLWQRQAHVKR